MQTLRMKAFRVVLSDIASRETEEIHRGGAKLKRLRNLLLASPKAQRMPPLFGQFTLSPPENHHWKLSRTHQKWRAAEIADEKQSTNG
jgi:hypothetical protein